MTSTTLSNRIIFSVVELVPELVEGRNHLSLNLPKERNRSVTSATLSHRNLKALLVAELVPEHVEVLSTVVELVPELVEGRNHIFPEPAEKKNKNPMQKHRV